MKMELKRMLICIIFIHPSIYSFIHLALPTNPTDGKIVREKRIPCKLSDVKFIAIIEVWMNCIINTHRRKGEWGRGEMENGKIVEFQNPVNSNNDKQPIQLVMNMMMMVDFRKMHSLSAQLCLEFVSGEFSIVQYVRLPVWLCVCLCTRLSIHSSVTIVLHQLKCSINLRNFVDSVFAWNKYGRKQAYCVRLLEFGILCPFLSILLSHYFSFI